MKHFKFHATGHGVFADIVADTQEEAENMVRKGMSFGLYGPPFQSAYRRGLYTVLIEDFEGDDQQAEAFRKVNRLVGV